MFPLLIVIGTGLAALGALMDDPTKKKLDNEEKPGTPSVLQPEKTVPSESPPPSE